MRLRPQPLDTASFSCIVCTTHNFTLPARRGARMQYRLNQIADIQLGYQPRTKLRHEPGGSHGVIQIKDVGDGGHVEYSNMLRIEPERDPERYEVNEEDVLLISRGAHLRAVRVCAPPLPVMAISFFYILRPKHGAVNPGFLFWALNQPPVQSQIRRQAMGTGIPHIRRKPVENLRIDIPSLETQRLTLRVDELTRRERDLSDRLVEKRSDLARAVCRQAQISPQPTTQPIP